MITYRKHVSGAREVFDIAAYKADYPGADVVTCGTCHRHWDDSLPTSVTPTPSARCPFEYQHKPERRGPRGKLGQCPNCLRPITELDNGCVLHAFIGVLRDRGNKPDATLRSLQRNCNVDQLWDDIGPILDSLEAGGYQEDDNGKA